VSIEPTQYYSEFIRYHDMAARQQEKSNFGWMPHMESGEDDLMRNIELYDVIERKYAGFSQLVNDCFYGWTDQHPYWAKMQAGQHTQQRETMAKSWDGKQSVFKMEDWLYLFLLHRVTGSAINYGTKPSGYHNTIIWDLAPCENIEDMVEVVKTYQGKMYTSIGYQFPAFPKPPEGSQFRRGGDYYLAEYAPRLVRELTTLLQGSNRPWDLREVGEWMFDWNKKNGLRAYKFQYAAFIADIADWFPQYVNTGSHFYYGTNAVECISYLARPTKRMKKMDFLDEVMNMCASDTGGLAYNLEDVACDFIRFCENYIRPGAHYDHVDRDTVWSSCAIKDHPKGRQKAMLDLGLVESFNDLPYHPSDFKVLEANGMSADEYKARVAQLG